MPNFNPVNFYDSMKDKIPNPGQIYDNISSNIPQINTGALLTEARENKRGLLALAAFGGSLGYVVPALLVMSYRVVPEGESYPLYLGIMAGGTALTVVTGEFVTGGGIGRMYNRLIHIKDKHITNRGNNPDNNQASGLEELATSTPENNPQGNLDHLTQ